ncbi:cation efflux family protein [Pochonia chlamydosporia 170]|uniref:Cation efflux family protein n=1 Tax=Pochonia chlamydosporia 170 TaxID=1380566 RepID=A0A179G8P4_METCM|nr:cation efflux family protein [Pochonia chlamydosporia 170]OAQ74177.1 cation efflux family protein [Pochonia chlamydosporia 170]
MAIPSPTLSAKKADVTDEHVQPGEQLVANHTGGTDHSIFDEPQIKLGAANPNDSEKISSKPSSILQSPQDDANIAAGNDAAKVAPILLNSETFRSAKYEDLDKELESRYAKRNRKKLKSFYTKQNDLIDEYLGVEEEEQLASDEEIRMRPRIRFAVYASFTANLCLFIIQMYAAISTGSLALFATAADAFMDLVSSCVMLITSKLARRPSIYKFPVGRTRIEPVGIIVFCALMATVAVQLLIESARHLADGERESSPLQPIPLSLVGVAILMKSSLMVYCFFYRRFPSVHVFFIDHRNDIVVNIFGLVMSIVGDHFIWYLDPVGAICIALLILFSWASNAFEQVWLLAGKGAPKTYVSKLIYVTLTHSVHVLKVDTCRAYHAGQKYYVEVDIVMDADTPLRTSHDVSQSLQRKLEGLADVERAFVHVDYEHDHNVHEEHKPLYENVQLKTLRDYFRSFIRKRRN